LTGNINIRVEIFEVLDRVDDSGTAPGSDDVVGIFGLEPGGKSSWIASADTHPLCSDSVLSLDFSIHVVDEMREVG
jgi:hypothetical protein